MRIRKRFPSTSLSSGPLSDPQLNRSQVVQQHHLQGSIQAGNTNSQPSDPPNQPLPQPSDDRLMMGTEKTRWVASGSGDEPAVVKQKKLEGEEDKDERWREEEKSNDIRKGSIIGAEVGTRILQPFGSSDQVGRWYEGDKIVPLKKRRRSFERRVNEGMRKPEKEKKIMKTKMKSKTNKKCVQQQNGDELQEGKEIKEGIGNSTLKKSKRGSVIMEGSRCSRVNGRGWRCCQQTLVGYSLCEHHLGKGRLRSMTSVRSRAMTDHTSTTALEKHESKRLLSSSSLVQAEQQENMLLDDNDDYDDDDEKKPLMVTKKRMKLGMVKARSISSLLGQTNNAIVTADNKNSS